MLLFYLTFGATFLGCLSVAQLIQYQDALDDRELEGLVPRQSPTFGIKMFPQTNFEGSAVVSTSASAKSPIPLGPSFLFLGNAYAAVTSNSHRIVLWDSAEDTSTLPLPPPPLSITDIQSFSCSPQCTSGGACSHFSPICYCHPGFNGTLCQFCSEGHFGPSCLPCPGNCTHCDQGMTGSGSCNHQPTSHTAAKCHCVNGECGTDGECNCLPGWTKSDNGTACATCASGFYLNPSGGCQTCSIGCNDCDSYSGHCSSCINGFTLNQAKCVPLPSKTSGGKTCPPRTFNDGGTNNTDCLPCAKHCDVCTGLSSNECLECSIQDGRAWFNNSCIATDANGICEKTGGMIVDNNAKKCEPCGAIQPSCLSCKIPNYNVASTIDKAECTRCIEGFYLSKGKCVHMCPSHSFPLDKYCTECSPSCKTCDGSADYCTSCGKNNDFALAGKCVNKCPQDTFQVNGTCTRCHPDCKTCYGTSYNQCISCHNIRPVLHSGRCLATCNQTQYLDTNTCKDCDPSCSSCSGPGPKSCLSCPNSDSDSGGFIVSNGTCFAVPVSSPG